MANQTANPIQVSNGRLIIKSSEMAAPAGATSQIAGVLNGRANSGSMKRSTSVPIETTVNAKQRSDADEFADEADRQQPGENGRDNSAADGGDIGRPESGVNSRGERRQQSVMRHGAWDSGLP